MSEGTQRRLAAIASADVVGYARLMGVDEVGTLAALRAHRAELIDPLIAEHGGRIVKTMGDGLLLEFPSVVAAVQCVISIQKGMLERNADVADYDAIRFRIGVHLGDVIVEGDDIFGDGVNVAARLEALADHGGICLSGPAFHTIHGKIDAAFEDAGDPVGIASTGSSRKPRIVVATRWQSRLTRPCHYRIRITASLSRPIPNGVRISGITTPLRL